MKNKVFRAYTHDCHWVQANWLRLMYSADLEIDSHDHRDQIQAHLRVCDQCRNEIGGYFLPEIWEAELKPQDLKNSILAGRVLTSLGLSAASENPREIRLPVPSNRMKLLKNRTPFSRIQPLLINFVTTAVIILALTWTGYFNLLPQLEHGVKMLSNQVGTAFYRTQKSGVNEFKAIWISFEHTLKDGFIFQKK